MTVLLLCMTSCEPVTRTELHEAIRAGDMAAVQQCLAARPGAVHDRDVLGDTPLHVAVQMGSFEMVELLLRHKADVNAAVNGAPVSCCTHKTARTKRQT